MAVHNHPPSGVGTGSIKLTARPAVLNVGEQLMNARVSRPPTKAPPPQTSISFAPNITQTQSNKNTQQQMSQKVTGFSSGFTQIPKADDNITDPTNGPIIITTSCYTAASVTNSNSCMSTSVPQTSINVISSRDQSSTTTSSSHQSSPILPILPISTA
jgi:hypothetical protein